MMMQENVMVFVGVMIWKHQQNISLSIAQALFAQHVQVLLPFIRNVVTNTVCNAAIVPMPQHLAKIVQHPTI
jgi:hypothetical protein